MMDKSRKVEYQKKWRESHREAGRAAQVRYRASHLEESRRKGREYWSRKHPKTTK